MTKEKSPAHASSLTRLLHTDRLNGVEHGATVKPMHVAAAYGYATTEDLCAVFQGDKAGMLYSRQGNPTTAALEAKITLLEGGVGTITFSSGMAALTSAMATLLKAGDHVVASQFLFGNTASWLNTLQGLGVGVTLVDATNAVNVEAAITPATRMVLVESIANPVTQVADLAGIGKLCQARGLVYLLDNTLGTPWLLQGKTVGASLVMHSLSKMMCGHGNALGGSLTDTGLFDWSAYPHIAPGYKKGNPQMWGLTQVRKKGLRDIGGALSGEHAHRIATGLETLDLRMAKSCATAQALAEFLAAQPQIKTVHYPGLPSHPQHARAMDLMHSGGTLLSIEPADGIDPFKLLNALQWVIRSTHLGDSRTMALPVAHTIFFEIGVAARAQMGIADNLIRVSVGLEAADDLIADFAQALAKAAA